MDKGELIAGAIGFLLGMILGLWIIKTIQTERRVHAVHQHRDLAKNEVVVPCKVRAVAAFLARFSSPLTGYAADFIAAADRYSLDWRLLPIVSCVESSCGKYYRRNAFGWGSDTLDFGDTREDIFGVASKLATLPYYAAYRKTGDYRDFAVAFNGKHAEDYYQKLAWFKAEFQKINSCDRKEGV